MAASLNGTRTLRAGAWHPPPHSPPQSPSFVFLPTFPKLRPPDSSVNLADPSCQGAPAKMPAPPPTQLPTQCLPSHQDPVSVGQPCSRRGCPQRKPSQPPDRCPSKHPTAARPSLLSSPSPRDPPGRWGQASQQEPHLRNSRSSQPLWIRPSWYRSIPMARSHSPTLDSLCRELLRPSWPSVWGATARDGVGRGWAPPPAPHHTACGNEA